MPRPDRCPLCDGGPSRTHAAREAMAGTGEPFAYGECAGCGSLWLLDPPDDLSPYYAGGYYSLTRSWFRERGGPLAAPRRLAFRRLVRAAWGAGTALDRAVLRRRPLTDPFAPLLAAGVPWGANVLDVGAGRGDWLRSLRAGGFGRKLLGIDPYLPDHLRHPDGVVVRKTGFADVHGGGWDLIAFHHVLEHLADPVGHLTRARCLLADGGKVLVRVPTCSSLAWERYGADWVQLDPPRHLVVPSRAGLAIGAERAGLRVASIADDSSAFQFWGSERYRAGLPLAGAKEAVPPARMAEWEAEARRLNAAGRGDQVVVWMEPADG